MKKVVFQLLVIILLIGTVNFKASAEGELKLPSISKINGYTKGFQFLSDGENLMVSAGEYSSATIGIVQASTGNMTRQLLDDDYGTSVFTANDKGTYFAGTNNYGMFDHLHLFNEFGESIFDEEQIDFQGQSVYGFDRMKFIPNSNTLLIVDKEHGILLGFDVENLKPLFIRNITNDGDLSVTSDYIAIIGDSGILILDTKGNYITTIDSDIAIKTIEFTSDGNQLVAGGESSQIMIFDVKNDFQQVSLAPNQYKLTKGDSFKSIDIDSNNKFLLAITENSGLKLFDFKNGNPIITNLDNLNIDYGKISQDGKYIAVRQDGYTYIYDGKNLKKRVVKIEFPGNQSTIELGKPGLLKIKAILADGTFKEINTGISWATNDVSKAYVKGGKLTPVKPGNVTVKAKYLGFELTAQVTILPDKTPPTLSGIKTLKIKKGKPFNPRTGVIASDLVDGNLTKNIIITGKVNTSKLGTYKLTYTVKDKAGNQIKVVQTITVVK